jgi:hypothetical protein
MNRHAAAVRRSGVAATALALTGALLLVFPTAASAAIVPNVDLGTAAAYSVLGAEGVSSAHNPPVLPTSMHQNLGVSPAAGTFITGFPPGQVLAPGVTDVAGSAQAQFDVGAAYDDTHTRTPLTGTTGTELGGKTLVGGVYAATTAPKGPLGLTGTLTLNGQGNPNTVWIFQTDSTLITDAASRVRLINGAQECNVYWQVLSSATLGANSTFVGNILALASVSVLSNVAVHGRVFARTAAVTLIDDHFTTPTCATSLPTPPTTAAPGSGSGPTTTTPSGGSATTIPGGGGGTGSGSTTTTLGLTVGIVGPPRTGVAPLPVHSFPWSTVLIVGVGGAASIGMIARRRMQRRDAGPAAR